MSHGGGSMFYLAVILIVLYLAGAGIYALWDRIRNKMRKRRGTDG